LVPFSLGKRDYIGRHLVVAEMGFVIAVLGENFDFDLEEGAEKGGKGGLGWRDNIVATYERDVRVVIRVKKD
jgi:hypothetical protein